MNTATSTSHGFVQATPQQNVQGGNFDYIISGAGCAGLSLLVRLLDWEGAADKKILVIDCDAKKANDRTWCFWEQEPGLFEPVVYKSWQRLWFGSATLSQNLDIDPYTYKLIRGSDFYQYCFEKMAQHPNVQFVQARVEHVESNAQETYIIADGIRYNGGFVFNSILLEKPRLKPHQYWLLQHFKGWIIETEHDCFNPEQATLMDFRVSQQDGTTFVYVLPFSKRRALVEYTLFSRNLLPPEQYNAALKSYLANFLQLEHYRVTDEEFGVIPMTNFAFGSRQHSVLHMGTAGGSTKASSGYTFRFIQKRADAIMESLRRYGHPFQWKPDHARFGFYDSVLLHILQHNKMEGAEIFSLLFKKNKASRVLRFLDNETSPAEELKLLHTMPSLPFTKAAIVHLLRRLKG